jgi:flagellar basal-body rod modification protein FlgD
MMNVGLTTKAFANTAAAKDNRLEVDKSKKMSATENPFGDKDIGKVLNEIADPNWVEPDKVLREKKKELDRDAFFKLMLAQMKNQDPYNPMQSHEMAAQLAQFTSLEQMFNMNKSLEDIKQGQAPVSEYQALNFIGKEISADSSLINRTANDEGHELRFSLNGDASDVKVTLKDDNGEAVKTFELHNLKKGKNSIPWNGYSEQGFKQGVGDYRFTVEARGSSGKIVGSDTSTSGRITGIQYTAKGPLLMVGDSTIYLSDVKKIVEPTAASAAMPVAPAPSMPQNLPPELAKALAQAKSEAEKMTGMKTTPPLAAAPAKPIPPLGKMLAKATPNSPMKMKGLGNE